MGHSALGPFVYMGRNPARTSGFSYFALRLGHGPAGLQQVGEVTGLVGTALGFQARSRRRRLPLLSAFPELGTPRALRDARTPLGANGRQQRELDGALQAHRAAHIDGRRVLTLKVFRDEPSHVGERRCVHAGQYISRAAAMLVGPESRKWLEGRGHPDRPDGRRPPEPGTALPSSARSRRPAPQARHAPSPARLPPAARAATWQRESSEPALLRAPRPPWFGSCVRRAHANL